MGKKQKRQWSPRCLSRVDVEEQFRLASDDLYVSTLKPPVVVDSSRTNSPLNLNLPAHLEGRIPRGFSIDPVTWQVYLDVGSLPPFLTRKREVLGYMRSLCQHEITHFTLFPASRQQEIKLLIAAYSGFKDTGIKKDPILGRSLAFLVNNIFGDFIGDSHLACLGYGKQNFRPLTVWRERATVKSTRLKAPGGPSPLWKVMTRLYEIVWKVDLGFSGYTQLFARERSVLSNVLQAVGSDWSSDNRWLHKLRMFASALEPLLLDLEMGEGFYIILPADFAEMCDHNSESSIGSDGGTVEDQALLDLLKHYGNNPAGFAGCVSALSGKSAEEAIRLMYRTRARQIAMKMEESLRVSETNSISKIEDWNPGDQLTGRNGLKLMDAFTGYGRPVPGVNTWRGSAIPLNNTGNRRAVYDLLLVIDSSGSMGWHPYEPAEERRGKFDRAALAGESAALYAIEHGAKVAVINFSGPEDLRHTDGFTTSLDSVEEVLLWVSCGGTVFPDKMFLKMLSRTKNPLLTLFLSDCALYNFDAGMSALRSAITRHDRLCVFQTCCGPLGWFCRDLADAGAEVYAIEFPANLVHLVIGRVARQYSNINEIDLEREVKKFEKEMCHGFPVR